MPFHKILDKQVGEFWLPPSLPVILTMKKIIILETLAKYPGTTAREIANKSSLSIMDTRNILIALAKKGEIELERKFTKVTYRNGSSCGRLMNFYKLK